MTRIQKESKSAGGVILNTKGEICVVSQHGKHWSLPKGHLEKDDDELSAAKRETAEESGITELKLIGKLGTYTRYRISKHNSDDKSELKHITMFLFTTTQMDLVPTDPDNPMARWVNIDDVADLLTHPKDKEFFLSKRNEVVAAIKQLHDK